MRPAEKRTPAGGPGIRKSQTIGGGLHQNDTTRKLTGNRCQCTACGECFNGVQPFDKHRTGDYAKPDPNARRCLTVEEMMEAGFRRNSAGFLTTESRPQRTARHRAAGVQGTRAPLAMHHQGVSSASTEMHLPAAAP